MVMVCKWYYCKYINALAPASVIVSELANEAHQKNDSTEI